MTAARRTIYTRGPCGCSMPGIVKLLERESLDKARKAKPKVRVTAVGRYVDTKHPAVARKVLKVLHARRDKIKPIVLAAFAKLTKADDNAKIIRDILAQLDSGDTDIDLTDALDTAMSAAFRRAAAMGMTQVGFEGDRSIVNQLDEKARDYAETRSAELVTDLGDTTLEDLRALITRGVEDGMSTDELSDAIDEMGAFGDARADTIARTELASAHVQGNVEGWRSTGEVEEKSSILGDLHNIDDVCDECADAGAVPLDDDFVAGFDFPPYHPNCICDVLPILSGSDDE